MSKLYELRFFLGNQEIGGRTSRVLVILDFDEDPARAEARLDGHLKGAADRDGRADQAHLYHLELRVFKNGRVDSTVFHRYVMPLEGGSGAATKR